jgi:8-oxo-dGTP diphosphatase
MSTSEGARMALAPAAIGIILSADKKSVLLVQREDASVWVLPGGGIETGESPEEAVVREVKEETGLHIRIERKCAEYYPINRIASFTHVFICRAQSGTLKLSSETSAIEFFSLDELPSTLFDLHKQWIEEGLHSPKLILKPLNQITYAAAFNYFIRHPMRVLRYLWTRFTKV